MDMDPDKLDVARRIIDAAEATHQRLITNSRIDDKSCGHISGMAWLKRVAAGFKTYAGIEIDVGEQLLDMSLWQTIVLESGPGNPDGKSLANAESLKEIAIVLLLFKLKCDTAHINMNFLKHLVVRNQAVHVLDSLTTSRFAYLTRLELQGNKLTFLPPSFADALPNMEFLYLSNNQLSKLPRSLDQRDKIELDAPVDEVIEEIFQEYGYPEQFREEGYAMQEHNAVRRVWAFFNAVALRSTFVKMTRLKVLWLDGNPLTSLPHELASLPRLTELCVEGCNQLPASLQQIYGASAQLGAVSAEKTRRVREWLVFDGLVLAAVRRCVNLVLVVRKNLPPALSRLVQEYLVPSVGLETGHPLLRTLSLSPSFRGGRVLRSGRLVEPRKRKMEDST